MGSLIMISGKQRGKYLPLEQRTSVIGRSESLPPQILDDGVSVDISVCFSKKARANIMLRI
jgi:hypothetical protein